MPIPALPYGPGSFSSTPLLPGALVTCFLDSAKTVLELLPPPCLTPLIHCAHCREVSLLDTGQTNPGEKSDSSTHLPGQTNPRIYTDLLA